MKMTEISADEQVRKGAFTVLLSSAGNIDHGQDPSQAVPGVRSFGAIVDSMSAASKACQKYIEKNDLGGGNWIGGAIFENGVKVAQVSYNGRIWVPRETWIVLFGDDRRRFKCQAEDSGDAIDQCKAAHPAHAVVSAALATS
jgi:hypothetical protein